MSAVLAVACTVAVVTAPACRRRTGPPPLRPNPVVAAALEQQRADEAFRAAAARMSPQAVKFLERSISDDDAGFQTVRRLRVYYESTAPGVLPWNELVNRRLPHVLWLIEHRADDPSSMWPLSRGSDPKGYARAADAWSARAAKSDVSPIVLVHAASFFTGQDNPRAEALLLRARSLDPEGRRIWTEPGLTPSAALWSRFLGQFYGRILTGPTNPANGRPTTALGADTFAADVRTRLLASSDSRTLAGAAQFLLQAAGSDADREALGRQLLDKALTADPSNTEAVHLKSALARRDREAPIRQTITARQLALAGPEITRKMTVGERLSPEEQQTLRAREFDAIQELPAADRLTALADLAGTRYLWSESLQGSGRDTAGARAALDLAKQAADAVLALAPGLAAQPDAGDATYRAHLVLALCALRGGNRTAALTQMALAADAPVSPPEATADPMLTSRLANYLLRAGERGTVALFLDKAAKRGTALDDTFARDAAAIRAGEMPMSYQHMFGR
jgi:hypothetical protein